MAKREAIRELQARLASRLAAAQAGSSAQWLAVRCGAAHYLLPLAQSGEIFPLVGLQPVPHTQPWFLGVLNVRGSLYGVADLQAFVAGGTRSRVQDWDAQARVITLNPALEINSALVVSALAGLRGPDDFAANALPPPVDASQDTPPAYLGARLTDAQGVVWQEIHVQALAQTPLFLNICA